ncbi:hypothetical protein ISF6_1155 [Piscinibacter sakaiensis]|uniref:Permease n=1 Tax=Piscinibacter sakaiensis TaxID=1547922 RepID=A0A0K8NYK8_PISS1|nr:hypothetical protein ISF6_1155 [Piscinibacter sakaiensis]
MLALLLAASLRVLQPFLVSAAWAVVIVVTGWPTMLALQQRLGGRRWAAITVLMLGLLVLLVLPVMAAVGAAVANAGEIAERIKQLGTLDLPAPPAWVAGLPVIGERLVALWQQVAAAGIEGLLARLAPYAGAVTRAFIARAGDIGFILVEIGLALGFAAMLFAQGEDAARSAARFGRRLAGRTGSDAVDLAMRAIRGVAIGVGGTAVLQSVLAGLGLAAAGVPFAALLTAVIFVSCIAQLGTPVVMLPAVIYVYWTGETGWGTALLVWSIIIGTADNVVRPLLIQRGVDLPFWMVFTGVVGGLIAFGLVGLFVGPVVLAVVGMLAERWLSGRRTGGADARPPGTD